MSNENAKLEYESGSDFYAMHALTDSGDHTTFTSSATYFSEDSGVSPDVKPNGILTGGVISPAVSGSNNVVDVTSSSANLNGVVTAVTASTDLSITRAATDVAVINSIIINSGGAYAAVKGTDSSDTSFSETRGGAGGPPYIAVDAIEVGQIRVTTNTAGPIVASEIFQVAGTHLETAEFPVARADNFTATVVMDQALPLIHTGNLPKRVYASYADPVFSEQRFANDFVAPERSYSVSSEQVYNEVVGSSTSSLGAGSFTAILKDGITDPILGREGRNLFFRFKQDRYKTPFVIAQGILGMTRSFGASDNPKGSFTISSFEKAQNRAS